MASRQKTKPTRYTAYERYEIVEVHRSELIDAPYNPRKIGDSQRKRLRDKIAASGLVMPPVWNARTGHLVAGHQRLRILDSLEKSKDYRLRVAKVDLEEKAERELNVFLNNANAQGEWDMAKFEELLKVPEFNLDSAGLDAGEIYQHFGLGALADDSERLQELAQRLKSIQADHRRIQSSKDDDDCHFYRVVVFASAVEAEAFNEAVGLPDDRERRFLDGRHIRSMVHRGQTDQADARVERADY